jgi:hypothetical protein
MSRKPKHGVKPTGNLEVKNEFAGLQGKRGVGIGAIVNAPVAGNQKVTTKIGTFTVDEDGLLIGAVVGDCTEDES